MFRTRTPAALLAAALAAPAAAPVAADGPTGPEPFLSLTAGEARLALGPTDIAALEISSSGQETDLGLRLDTEAARTLAEMTAAAVGTPVHLTVCGVPAVEGTVQQPILSGYLYLAGLDAVKAEEIRALWHGRAACDTPETADAR